MSWFDDQEICKFNSHGKFFKTRKYFEEYIESTNKLDKVVWAICHVSDGHIGNIALQNISIINRNAELAVIIGNSEHHGKGVAYLAASTMIRHGFYKLNLERIYCGTAANNTAMSRLAISIGMLEEGRRRKHIFLDGEWVDMVEYGLLREEYDG
jgi:ribosomal-protein-alanine N-acetyltransferase